MQASELVKIARIVQLRSQLAAKKEELDDLVVQYVRQNPGVPWRKLARGIRMDFTQLYKFAKSKGLISGKEWKFAMRGEAQAEESNEHIKK